MKSSPASAHPLTLSEHEELVELRSEVARIQAYLTAIEPALIAFANHVDAAPPPRFEVPKGFLTVKQASGVCGYSPPTIYRWVRQGRIVGMPYGGNIYVDPGTLPAKKILGVSKMIK